MERTWNYEIVKWHVAKGSVPDPLLGRAVLEALGINTKELLEAAIGKIGTSVDVDKLMGHQSYPDGSIARIIKEAYSTVTVACKTKCMRAKTSHGRSWERILPKK